MKTLLLARHAKSDWGDPLLDDHDRPLNARGHHDAPAMGRRLAERGIRIDRIVTSTAVRARSTAREFARALGIPLDEIEERHRLYEAWPDQIIAATHRLGAGVESVMLVGHNPGMSMLASMLAGDDVELPTCAIAEFRLDIDRWADAAIDAGHAELIRVDTPHDAETATT